VSDMVTSSTFGNNSGKVEKFGIRKKGRSQNVWELFVKKPA